MGRRPRAVRLAIPAAFVAVLTLVALWRVSGPLLPVPGTPAARPEPLEPLTQIAEVLADNSVGRRASLERVVVRDIPSPRTLWIGTGDERVLAVLDPDVKNLSAVPVQIGARLTLIGLVRAVPPEETAIRQWALDPATAKSAREHGTYLYVTEIRDEEIGGRR
jgi:hypothetical protein